MFCHKRQGGTLSVCYAEPSSTLHAAPCALSIGKESCNALSPRGILDLALTAADRYALSLLPNAVKGTGLSTDGTHQQPSPGEYQYRAHNHPVNGVSPALRQRGQGQQMLHTMPQPAGSPSAGQQPPQLDSRMVNSWDNSLKEILSALEPDGKSIKPVGLAGTCQHTSTCHRVLGTGAACQWSL